MRKYIFIAFIAILFLALKLFYIKNNAKKIVTPQKIELVYNLPKIEDNRPTKGITNNRPQIKNNTHTALALKNTKPSHLKSGIIIPGRAMKSMVVTPDMSQRIILGGAEIDITEGTMPSTKSISITGLLAADLNPVPAEILNVTNEYPGYRFLPHGMIFSRPATVCMKYDESLIPEGFTADDIYTYYFDENDAKWKALKRDSVDHSNNLIVSNTLHFTDMINGIIRVPESTETGGYVPTTLKNIKAADPMSGITLMSPPSPNKEGDANVVFPFKLPLGRSGMQPKLELQYSLGYGSGWTGFGWDIPVSAISVDILWGVPRYLQDKESETYVFSGSQLTPVAHRSDYIARSSEKRFYSRIEGDFNKIIRHGNSPKNYWWEVTSKDGKQDFYGGTPETGLLANAITVDASGNIGYWALVTTRDAHGNNVKYAYEKPTGCGEKLYLGSISYTGKDTTSGPYKITFLHTDAANTYTRKDAVISARRGYLERDKELLKRINVTFKDTVIRSYRLWYKEGAFSKTLLDSLSELDADGNIFYTHRFAYHDDVQFAKGYVPYDSQISFKPQDDNIHNSFINPIPEFNDNISALGGSGSLGGGAGISLTVGLMDGQDWCKDMTAGGNAAYNGSKGYGLISITDINGDGMADKVYKKDGKIYYRPNIQDSVKIYGDPIEIKGIDNFSLSTTNGFALGVEANPPYSYVGYNFSKNYSKTPIYFTDYNGDGLVDLAYNGKVYFNHIDENGNPVFTASSDLTPNPVYVNSNVDPSMLPNTAAQQTELARNNPLHDAVRMWRVPYTGWVKINAPVQLLKDSSAEALADMMKDGVKVSIQYKGLILWSTTIDSGDYNPQLPLIDSFYVEKGNNIYFRVQSGFNGYGDKVKWDPEIKYCRMTGLANGIDTSWVDINNKKIARYKASEDFVLCGLQTIGMPKNGMVGIKTVFNKPYTTDNLDLKIIWRDSSGITTTVFQKKYNNNPVNNDIINLKVPVVQRGSLTFKVNSTTYIDWAQVKWNIYLQYDSLSDGSSVYNALNQPMYTFNAVPEFTDMYNLPVFHADPVIANPAFISRFGTTLKLVPEMSVGGSVAPKDSVLLLSVKNWKKIFGLKKYNMLSSTIFKSYPNDTLAINIQPGDTLHFEYYTSNYDLAANSSFAKVKIIAGTKDTTFNSSLYSSIYYKDERFGKLYRGWGQFDYFGDSTYATSPINESELILNENKNNNVASIKDTSGLHGINNPMGNVFSIMAPYALSGNYLGTDQMVYVSGDKISSSRRGQKNVYVAPYVTTGGGLVSLPKESEDMSNNLSAGLSILTGSYSWAGGKTTCDMMDMNGDGYPDYLTTDKIQYTNVLGGLDGNAVTHNLGNHSTKAEAQGIVLGGSFVAATSTNTSTTKKTTSKVGDSNKSNSNSKTAEKVAVCAIGLSGSFSTNKDETNSTWMDINNDGLPDKVYSDGTVSLNLGYSFAPAEDWGFGSITKGESTDYSAGLGVNLFNGSISAGVSLSKTKSNTTENLMDVNGDGLPDYVNKSSNTVRFNTGSGFSDPVTWNGMDLLEANESVGEAASAGFTISFDIPIIALKISINPSANICHGVSRATTELTDFTFDGFPDYVTSSSENELLIKPSTINRTNLLKTVYRPLGSNFTMDYIQSAATYKHPGGKWVVQSVQIYDGLQGDGVDTTLVTFDYRNGFYNRHERQFFGYDTVLANYHNTADNNAIYRTKLLHYDNSSYYKKGLTLSETLLDGNGNKQTGYENSYSLLNIHTGEALNGNYSLNDTMPIFVALSSTKQYVYEGANYARITTRVAYSYDAFGNIASYTDYATGNDADLLKVDISYHTLDKKYIYSTPKLQRVYTNGGTIRQRKTEVNSYGDIIHISQFINQNDTASFDMTYDDYGNLSKIIHPANYKGERMFYNYTYDPVVHSFVTNVTDAYGYSSSTNYTGLWGAPIETTDKNGEKVRYTYDNRGRVKTVTGPYEIASGEPYTIAVNYNTNAAVPYAQTLHYDSILNSNIETYTFIDGLGRPVQVKKTVALFNGEGKDDTPGYTVSGKIIYDAFGREVVVYQPVFEANGNASKYNGIPDAVTPTTATYDVTDRTRSVTLPDGSGTSSSYGVGTYNGENVQVDTLTDALGHQTVTYIDTKGRHSAEIIKSNGGDINTSYVYNPIGELLDVTDPKGNHTSLKYDFLGRRLSINQPDAGLTEFTYDNTGNLLSRKTANLRKQIPDNGQITYKYNYERLVEIDYPRNVQNKVEYSYGAPGASFGRAGRITLIQDASGGQEFYYGRLGEITKTIRSVMLSETDMRTWIWSANYDTWNRMQTMTYPDGEKLTYSYNAAGNLKSMSGSKQGRTYNYLSQIGYNKEEKQVYLRYGNGSVTTYAYDSLRLRLSGMGVTSNNQKLMNNTYKYDVLNNILSITNSIKPGGAIGGSTSHAYLYDDLNRLTNANGRYIGRQDTSTYTLSMQYGIMGNVLRKNQSHLTNSKKQTPTTYDLEYKYAGNKPNAPSSIGGTQYSYDENGNLTFREDTSSASSRLLSWDEENRLIMISDDGYISNYTYDASGKRVIKSHGGSQGVYLNGIAVGVINHSDANYTVYVNPYFTMDANKFTKHYYNGNTRIASKTGNGKFENQFRSGIFEITAGGVNYIKRLQQIEDGVKDYYAGLKITPGPPTMKGVNGDPYLYGSAIPNTTTSNTQVPPGWPHQIVYPAAGGPPGAPVQYGDSVTNPTAAAGFGYFGTGDAEETLCYFIHSDHLGSTSYVTNNTGNITQFMAYMPFGETFIEGHSTYDNPFKFNAKELDNETGLYFLGPRYYDPKISMHYAAGSQNENKYSSSPFIYSSDNPVIFIDSTNISSLSMKISNSKNILENARSKTKVQGQVQTQWSIVDDPDVNTDTPDVDADVDDDSNKEADKADNNGVKKNENNKIENKDNEKNENNKTKTESDNNANGSKKKNDIKDAKNQTNINLKEAGKKNQDSKIKEKSGTIPVKKNNDNKNNKTKETGI